MAGLLERSMFANLEKIARVVNNMYLIEVISQVSVNPPQTAVYTAQAWMS